MKDKEILEMLQEIKERIIKIEHTLHYIPDKLTCERKHARQHIFNIVISIILMIYLFNFKLSHILKFLGL